MCRTQSFKYTVCGHFFSKIISTCGGTITHISRAGITKASCNPAKSLKKTKDALVIHYPQMCAFCAKEAIKADGQQKVAALEAQSKLAPLKILKRRALQAEREHQELCTVLDRMVNIAAPMARRDLTLPSPQMRKPVVGGSPLKNQITLEMPDVAPAFQDTIRKPAAIITPVRPKLTLRLRQTRKTIQERTSKETCRPCNGLAGTLEASLEGSLACTSQRAHMHPQRRDGALCAWRPEFDFDDVVGGWSESGGQSNS